ncbi:hypothetical protein MLD38_015387 [Melastoma candidum]|uniref:Uncharacterized protein n=1 Tax=Melastoma candidum TaxID=119954 RepID=A0ACB9RH37_9MYRT|nr:hypothetical protein MLD38_015387 [Melastoma candidum]
MAATAGATGIRTFEEFAEVHAVLLASSGLPPSLHRRLFDKLSTERFDGGQWFGIEQCDEDARQRRLVMTSESHPSMASESDVFLVDHAWTFRLSDAYRQLKEVPGLAERMAALMCVDVHLEDGGVDDHGNESAGEAVDLSAADVVEREVDRAKDNHEVLRWLELDELGIDDHILSSLSLSRRCPDLIALSLCDNRIENEEMVFREVSSCKHLRALWLNNNPILEKRNSSLADKLLQACPGIEILNSVFTRNFGVWALGFCGGLYGKDNPGFFNESEQPLQGVTSLNLSNRHIRNLVNTVFSCASLPSLSYLNLRGNSLEENSSQEFFKILSEFSSLNALEVDIPGPLGESALFILESLPNLCLLNGVNAMKIIEAGKHVIDSVLESRLPEWKQGDSLVDRVISAMWLYLMTYRLADEEKIDETSVWYVMDELGSALRHSDEPNFMVAPFLYMPEGKLASAVSYSLLWPIKNVAQGEECTRDFLHGIGEDKQRSARLTAWFHTPESYFIQLYEKYIQALESRRISPSTTVSSEDRTLLQGSSPLHVYTDIPQVEELLRRPEFVLTSDPKHAHIIWTSMQVDEETKKAVGMTDEQYINQFPYEACIVMKHHLAETIQKAMGSPPWLQPTYNLETQLSPLIGDYHARSKNRQDNLWILKPWNMARTIDTTVTDNLSAVIRLMETGPKICQKYIEHPALFQGKKFDLRYIVLVCSISPLKLFLSHVFWVRLANNPYTLEKHSLFEYETHFTVMNYRGILNYKPTPEFVREFEGEHKVTWMDIHERVRQMIRSVFEAAAATHPQMHNPMSWAIYGVDVMLDSSFQPKLLEVTYCPDCTRACKYDVESIFGGGELKGREFFNDVFGCLFLDETTHVQPL